MALVGNGFRLNTSPLRYSYISATVALGGGASSLQSFTSDGKRRNLWASEADIDLKASVPAGARHPASWLMAPQAGGIASRNNAEIKTAPAGNAVLGLPATGGTTITLTVNDATGGLIVSASGSAEVSITANGSILSVASASGSATVTVSASALIGALAGIQGQGNIALTPAGAISAIGYLAGLSTNETEFSAAALANAVWQAAAATYNDTGSMGEKLNSAGGGSSPTDIANEVWSTIIESGLDAQEILRVIAAVAAGDATGLEGSAHRFKSIDGTKTRITANYSGGNRTISAIDGS